MSAFLHGFLFIGLPYLALITFVFVSWRRYREHPFTYSSLSSQVLENEQHFWGLVPFHYGITLVLLGHLVAFFIPRTILLWNQHPLRLLALETTGFALAAMSLFGLGNIIIRRLSNSRVAAVTSTMDWVLYAVLLVQIASGLFIALFHRWGSTWFAAVAAPYLWSLVTLQPETTAIAGMPFLVKLHIVNAYLFFLVFPFTRLVHVLVAPFHYLTRKPQIVRWSHSRQLAKFRRP